AEQSNNTLDLIKFTNNLGITYDRNEDYDKALEYYKKSLDFALKQNDENSEYRAYGNIGSVYINLDKFDTALIYLRKILVQDELTAGAIRLANAFNNAGEAYRNLNQLDSAMYCFKKASYFWDKLESPELSIALSNIGQLYATKNEFDLSLENILKSNEIASSTGEKKLLATNYHLLAEIYSEQNKFDLAYEAMNQYVLYNDSVFNTEKDKTISELQTKYETEKKEKANLALQQKNLRQRTYMFSISGAAILIFIVLMLFYSRRQLKKKLEFEQELKSDRIRISSDLHDDIGSTLGSISYFSQLAKLQQGEPDENMDEILGKIDDISKEAIENMGDIVWTINPINDNFDRLLTRMKNYANNIFKSNNIRSNFIISDAIKPEWKLRVDLRKNLFLLFKEAYYNAVKYASCKNITITISRENNNLTMTISDDGVGFDPENTNAYNGNGMRNMRNRAAEISAAFSITSSPGKGTTITIVAPHQPV
ncbi:MAG: ATP-binding protein, partial [Chitinophagales bacterium]